MSSTIQSSVVADAVERVLLDGVPAWDTRIVDLGVTRFRLRTNVPGFSGFRYFSRVIEAANGPESVPYELICIDLDHPHALDERAIRRAADDTFRSKRFRAGFYLTGHFGAPATLISRGSRRYVIGRGLDRVVWGWYVKDLLTAHALRHQALHVKAACLAIDDTGVLLIGRGSGGKTVFLTQMCQEGAAFVSNTHVIIDSTQTAWGVPTTLRVREDPCFGALIRSGGLRPHLAGDDDEFVADPAELFARSLPAVPVRAIAVVDYHAGRSARLERLTSADAYDIFEQFGFPISTYGMKDDVLDCYAGDFAGFVSGYADMKRRLHDLVSGATCVYASGDMMDPRQRANVRRILTT